MAAAVRVWPPFVDSSCRSLWLKPAADSGDKASSCHNSKSILLYCVQETWLNMAMEHARQVAANHVRPDGTTYHIVEYNPNTGDTC